MVVYASIEQLLEYKCHNKEAFERLVHEWIEPSYARIEVSQGYVKQVYGDWRDDPVWMRWEEDGVPVFRLLPGIDGYPFDPLLFLTHEIAHIVERDIQHLYRENYGLPWITFPELFPPGVLDLEIRINAIQLNIEEGLGCLPAKMKMLEQSGLLAVTTNGYGPDYTEENKQFVFDGFNRYRRDPKWSYENVYELWKARVRQK